jgi:hypothetical protein
LATTHRGAKSMRRHTILSDTVKLTHRASRELNESWHARQFRTRRRGTWPAPFAEMNRENTYKAQQAFIGRSTPSPDCFLSLWSDTRLLSAPVSTMTHQRGFPGCFQLAPIILR